MIVVWSVPRRMEAVIATCIYDCKVHMSTYFWPRSMHMHSTTRRCSYWQNMVNLVNIPPVTHRPVSMSSVLLTHTVTLVSWWLGVILVRYRLISSFLRFKINVISELSISRNFISPGRACGWRTGCATTLRWWMTRLKTPKTVHLLQSSHVGL